MIPTDTKQKEHFRLFFFVINNILSSGILEPMCLPDMSEACDRVKLSRVPKTVRFRQK